MNTITNTSKVTSKYTLPDGVVESNAVNSNTTVTMYMTEALVKSKVSSKQYGFPNDEITQTITLINNADYDIQDMRLKETIGSGASFKEGSVMIDGTPKADLDIVAGFSLEGGVPSGGAPVEIDYILKISSAPFINDRVQVGTHLLYSIFGTQNLEEDLTPVEIKLIEENVTVTKFGTPSAVVSNQKLTFINIIKNNGNIVNTDVMFNDPIPTGTRFVEGSVLIDDEPKKDLNVETGFKLPDLQPKGEIKVTFDVIVD